MFFSIVVVISDAYTQPPTQSAQDSIAYHKKDSILTNIYKIIDEARYTDAHNETVSNLYKYRNDYTMIPPLYAMLSNIERLTGDNSKALGYMKKSEEYLLLNGREYANKRMHLIYHQIANIYFEMREFDSAYVYASRSIEMVEKYTPDFIHYNRKLNLPIVGYHYFLQGDYAKAENTYYEALEYCAEFGEVSETSLIFMKLAEVKNMQDKYAEAVYWGDKAMHIADSTHNVQYQLATVNTMLVVYKKYKNFEKLSEYLQLKLDLEEKIKLGKQQQELQELQTKFDTRLKEEENKSLKLINKKQEIQNRFQVIMIILACLVMLVIFVFAISFFYQKRRISRQKEAVDSLNKLNRKIFSVISHDLKGPMLGIETLLDMNEKYKMDAGMFSNQARQLKNDLKQANLIMENLLSWSKAETGISGFLQTNTDTRKVTEEIGLQLQSLIDQKKLILENQIPKESMLAVPPDIMKIIYRNLLSNAIKYSYEGGTIVFGYDPGTKKYEVRDSGTGMEEDTRQQLFKQETRSKLGTRHETGYGIGLNIVYELVRKYGGEIWAESIPGKGTSLYFRFA